MSQIAFLHKSGTFFTAQQTALRVQFFLPVLMGLGLLFCTHEQPLHLGLTCISMPEACAFRVRCPTPATTLCWFFLSLQLPLLSPTISVPTSATTAPTSQAAATNLAQPAMPSTQPSATGALALGPPGAKQEGHEGQEEGFGYAGHERRFFYTGILFTSVLRKEKKSLVFFQVKPRNE